MQHTIPDLTYALDDSTDYTSSAFLVAALHWAAQHGAWQPFQRLLAVDMKTVTYSPLHKVQTIIASLLVGCAYMKDINTRLVPDPVAAAALGLARFPDQSQCNLLLRRLDRANIGELSRVHAEHLRMFEHLAPAHWHGYALVDIDQCGVVADGKTYELARQGYFCRKRGARGYQLSMAWLGHRQLTLGLYWDEGNVHCSTRLRQLVEQSAAHFGAAVRRIVYRLDGGYGSAPQIRWLQQTGRHFIAKSAVRRADKWAARVPASAWQPVNAAVQVAEVDGAPGVRAIVCAVRAPSGGVHYSVLLTNLPAEHGAVALWHLYAGRQTIEAFFKTSRHVYGVGNLRSREFAAQEAFMWLMAITHNLVQWIKESLFAGTPLAMASTRQLVERVGRIPARREQTTSGWCLHLPSHDALARLFVRILCPAWIQLPLRLYET